MRSQFIEFPEPGRVRVGSENVAAPQDHQILARARFSLVSTGTELACLRGEFDPGTNWESWVRYPFRPGYSMVAEVMEAGRSVRNLAPGDRVFVWASHQEYLAVDASSAYRIPDDVTDEEAAWGALAVTAGVGAARAAVQLGESVGVIGLGPLGQISLQLAMLRGAGRLWAIDTDLRRLDIARVRGATDVLAATAGDAVEQIAAETEGGMLDVVFDVTGNPVVLSSAVRLCRVGGRVVLIGDTPTPSRQALGPGVVSNSLSIIGAHAGLASLDDQDRPLTRRALTDLFFRLIANGALRVRGLIGERVAPSAAEDAYRRLGEGRVEPVALAFDWATSGDPPDAVAEGRT